MWDRDFVRRYAYIKDPAYSTPDGLAKTTVAQASDQAFWGKRVRFKAFVIAKAISPYLVPSIVEIQCPRLVSKACGGCPLSTASPKDLFELKLNEEAAIALVDGTPANTRALVARTAGVAQGCKTWAFEIREKANIQDLLISGHFSSLVSDEEVDVNRRVLYIGHNIRANALYTMDVIVGANPKTNEVVYICDLATAEQDDILNIEVTDEMKVAAEFFRPARPNDPRSIRKRLEDIYNDYADNVTNIYGREALHQMIDIGYHSVLCWRWEGEETLYKGTTEILVLGDSGQGKSETMMKMRDHYGRGERIDCKSATYAGLIGGLEDMAGRRWMYWGRIPQNDRGLVVLDEVKGMPRELIAQMTDVRSSQMAIVTRIGGARRTAARVRYFWLSNPRAHLRINEYSNGVTAVLDLLGMPEDVRRLDCAIIVSSGEVDQDYIDAKVTGTSKVEHVHTKVLSRALLALVWSRTETTLDGDIKKYIVHKATEFAKLYSPQIPLLEPADARLKLARLSIALAARLGSFTEDWSGIRVERAHVDVIVDFLRQVYNAENFAFDRWSEGQRDTGERGDDEFRRFVVIINDMIYPSQFVRAIANAQWITRELLYAAIGADNEGCRAIVAELMRMNYIRKGRNNYTKLPKMIAALRTVQDEKLAREHGPASEQADDTLGL